MREVIRCQTCNLNQFAAARCRRCHHSLSLDELVPVVLSPLALVPLCSRIKSLRIKRGLSQQQLAEAIGVCSKTYISKIERGVVVNLRIKTVERFAAALGVTAAELADDGEARRIRELLSSPLIAEIVPFVSALTPAQRDECVLFAAMLASGTGHMLHG